MAHIIEPDKSGRASCRTCKEKIPKAELRFGEEVPNQFSDGPSYQWHHLRCAATKKGALLKPVLEAFAGNVPDKAGLLAECEKNASKTKPATFPYAEKAPTGRSKCLECDEAIEKGALRVAIEREVDTGSFARKSAGYLHPACAIEHTGDDDLLAAVKKNSAQLAPADVAALEKDMAAGGGGDEDESDEDESDEDPDDDDEEDDDEEDESVDDEA